jgi:hypothetical protein
MIVQSHVCVCHWISICIDDNHYYVAFAYTFCLSLSPFSSLRPIFLSFLFFIALCIYVHVHMCYSLSLFCVNLDDYSDYHLE